MQSSTVLSLASGLCTQGPSANLLFRECLFCGCILLVDSTEDFENCSSSVGLPDLRDRLFQPYY